MNDPTPAQVEAEGAETVTIDWDGIDVVIPTTAEKLPAKAIEALEDEKAMRFMRHLVGSKRYDDVVKQWEKRQGRVLLVEDMTPFMEKAAKALGFDTAGN